MKANNILESVKTIDFKAQIKDILFITFGISLYGVGYTAFILPEHIVMGGVSGISALLFYAFNFNPAISIFALNVLMLLLGMKALTRKFVIRTIIGVGILSVIVGALQPLFQAFPLITPGKDVFMHVLIGALMSGAGLGIVFSHNGSTGGTDIIIAVLNKYFRMSFGRAMQIIDITIICSSYILFHSTEIIVYGVAFTLIASLACDYVINGSKQTVQFIIFSKEYVKIADAINHDINRGVTLIEGKGWYSKKSTNMLIVMSRKHESQDIMKCIKSIDPNALVSQTFCHGVFGEGFDRIS